jgi:hypothetical protein
MKVASQTRRGTNHRADPSGGAQVEKPDEEGPEQEPVAGLPEEPTENGPDEARDEISDF